MKITLDWQPLAHSDLDRICAIAACIHPSLPERPEVLAEKIRLFPHGCGKLLANRKMMGYGIAHPWMLNAIPPLDAFLGKLPAQPECLYIHDIAVLPEARGHNAAESYIHAIKILAANINIRSLALVSVYETDVLWNRFGFHIVRSDDLACKLATYGPTAQYMICDDHGCSTQRFCAGSDAVP
jgi:GNAT superfamily N-acetyltransferase